jgi:hypothetical protein
MLVRDSRTSSANSAFGRHDRQDGAGMRIVTAAPTIEGMAVRGFIEAVNGAVSVTLPQVVVVMRKASYFEGMSTHFRLLGIARQNTTAPLVLETNQKS